MNRKQYEVLNRASLFLEKNKCEPRIAEMLLMHHLDMSRAHFYAQMQELIPPVIIDAFQSDIKAHVKTGIPVQHLLGYEYFYGRKFHVNKHVLIPRPETEELIHHVLKVVKQIDTTPIHIVDVGTGSGVIAVTLALEIPNATILATDISKQAIAVAKENAKRLKANVQFFQGDFLQPIIAENKQVNIVISNPPYIAKAKEALLSRTVKDFDPALALFADDDGLAAYKKITDEAQYVLTNNGVLAFEIGHQQGPAVKKIITGCFPSSESLIIQDINKKDRIVLAKLSK